MLHENSFPSECTNRQISYEKRELRERRPTRGLLSLGGGYFQAGPRHSRGVFQLEYKWEKYILKYLRPQITLISPQFDSIFFGVGLGLELYLSEHVILTPNFEPGLYFNGMGRNLGFPVEFRSGLELCIEDRRGIRFGCQLYHLSNAHLSNRNPGANALILIIAFPH